MAWVRFTVLLIALSIPFWIVGSLGVPRLAPGLPISALMAVCPAAVVALLTLPGRRGARWWKRQLTVGLIWPRPTPAALLGSMATMPLVVFLAAMVHGSSMTHLLELRIWTKALLLIGPLLLAAAAEEIGWTAWLLPRLAAAEGRWPAALLIGVTWGAWHSIPYVQAGNPASWISGQLTFSVIFRLLIVQAIATGTAPVLRAVLLHATYNLAWQLLVASGAPYPPWTTSVLTGAALVGLLTRQARSATTRP